MIIHQEQIPPEAYTGKIQETAIKGFERVITVKGDFILCAIEPTSSRAATLCYCLRAVGDVIPMQGFFIGTCGRHLVFQI